MEKFWTWWSQRSEGLNLQWVEHVVLLVCAAAFAWVVWRFIFTQSVAWSEKRDTKWDIILLESINLPINVLIFFVPSSYIVGSFLDVGTSIDTAWLPVFRRILFFACTLWMLFRLVNATEAYLMTSEKRDHTTVSGIGHVLRLILIFIGLLVALQQFGISLTGVLTVGGVGGLVVGLAAKDVLSNFFGGMMIYFDRPFKVGDWINSPDRKIEGTVERIGLRMTMIRKFDSRPLYVPNSVFSSVVVQNPSRMKHRRINETIGLRYKDADKMAIIVAEVKKMLLNHPEIEQKATLMVNFDTFAGSSLNFFIYAFTKTTNWARFHDIKQDVMLNIVDIVHAHGADFAFPSRTISFERDDPPESTLLDTPRESEVK